MQNHPAITIILLFISIMAAWLLTDSVFLGTVDMMTMQYRDILSFILIVVLNFGSFVAFSIAVVIIGNYNRHSYWCIKWCTLDNGKTCTDSEFIRFMNILLIMTSNILF